jgi:hypothetical protein
MKKFLFHFAFIALPYISASVLQVFDIGEIRGFQNLFWGSVFGIGWFVVGHALNFVDKLANFFGFFVWPSLVCFGLYKWSVVALNSKNIKIHGAMLFLSLLIVVTYKTASEPPFSHLPLFFPILDAAF